MKTVDISAKEVREAAASFRHDTGVAWVNPRSPVKVVYDVDGDVIDIDHPEEWPEVQIFAILTIARSKLENHIEAA